MLTLKDYNSYIEYMVKANKKPLPYKELQEFENFKEINNQLLQKVQADSN